MYNASVTLDGFPAHFRKGKESDDSCSESVRVEYDSRSSSHEDFDEYLQLKNGNMMKATERQRQLLRERSNARITNIRVPDTYFEQIGSILKRSLYLRNAEKSEESYAVDTAEGDPSPIGYEIDPSNEFFLGRETLQTPSSRQTLQFPTCYERETNSDNYLYATQDLTGQREVDQETRSSPKRDVLSDDTLDEIRSFVDQYNEQEQNSGDISSINNIEYYEAKNAIPKHIDSTSKIEKHKRIPKKSLTKHVDRSLAEARKQSKSLRSSVARKSDISASLGQRKKNPKRRDDSGNKQLPEDESVLQWETQKKENKQRIRSAIVSGGALRKKKHKSASRMVHSSDSDRTIVADRKSKTNAGGSGATIRKHTSITAPHTTSRHSSSNAYHSTTQQFHIRTQFPHFISSEDLAQIEMELGITSDAYLTEDRSASDITEKPDKRRPTAPGRVPMNSLKRAEIRTRKNEEGLAEKSFDGGAFGRRKVKKGKRAITGGPMNSLLRAEARMKTRASSDYADKSNTKALNKTKHGEEKKSQDGIPMLLWSADTRMQTKKKTLKKHRAAKEAVDCSEVGFPSPGRSGQADREAAEGALELGELMDPRAAGDAYRDSDSSSKSPHFTLEYGYATPGINDHHDDEAADEAQKSPRYRPTHVRPVKNATLQDSSGNTRGLSRNVIKRTPLATKKKPFR